MFTVLITGASSGLGLGFLEKYASQASTRVIALDLVPLPPAISSSHDNVEFYETDIMSSGLSKISQLLETQATPINLLIHSAGIRGLVQEVVKEKKGDVPAAETYGAMNHATMMRTLEINTWGTFNVIKTFLPLLKFASSSSTPPKVIITSSRMGSISANVSGGAYAYRASKAALNAVVKSFSIDVPEVVFLLLHPGRVETGLVEWKEEGAMTVEESLKTCVPVIERATREQSGFFLDRFGETIAW